MSHCEEPNETGGCTNCGKCGKGRLEKQYEDFPINRAQDNHLNCHDSILFPSFTSDGNSLGKRLLVLNNIGPRMPSAPESVAFTELTKMSNQE